MNVFFDKRNCILYLKKSCKNNRPFRVCPSILLFTRYLSPSTPSIHMTPYGSPTLTSATYESNIMLNERVGELPRLVSNGLLGRLPSIMSNGVGGLPSIVSKGRFGGRQVSFPMGGSVGYHAMYPMGEWVGYLV